MCRPKVSGTFHVPSQSIRHIPCAVPKYQAHSMCRPKVSGTFHVPSQSIRHIPCAVPKYQAHSMCRPKVSGTFHVPSQSIRHIPCAVPKYQAHSMCRHKVLGTFHVPSQASIISPHKISAPKWSSGGLGLFFESQAGGRHMECACYGCKQADGTWNVPATFSPLPFATFAFPCEYFLPSHLF